jgi:predicted ATPase/class 3 adenylate cyclase
MQGYDAAMSSSVRTLFFSDIEGSTDLLQRAGDQYAGLLLRHREIVRAAVQTAGGTEHGTEGDSFFVSFDSPSSALAAAVQAQRQLEAFDWPAGLRLRVRIGLHLGETEHHDSDLVGLALHHAARIAATAHGGQIVLSEAVQSMARVLPADTTLHKLGSRRLRDVGPVTLFQVVHPELQESFPELRGVVANRTNLPRIATTFIGAERLLASIDAMIESCRIVTLTGTGGVGKTRAAVEVGWRSLDNFDDGVFFVDLAPISDSGAVTAAVAATLPTVSPAGLSPLDAIVEWMDHREVLLIVDNCEHLLDEVSALVRTVIAGCDHVRVLATSREPLGAPGERVLRVPSLDVASDALELFCERAAAGDSSFERVGHEAVLAQICQRLDGIPLAIELAAARTRSLSPEELLLRLQDRFRLLRGSGRGTLERHQTLRSTVSWSYQLLSDAERLLFDRLSVFAGGFDLRGAEAVCGTDPLDDCDVFDLVDSLVDKSMVLAQRTAMGTRFRLQETLRQFGEEQLELRGETTPLRDRHKAHYAEQVHEYGRLVLSSRQLDGTAKFSLEWDNLRAAHQWALASEDLDLAEGLIDSSFDDAFTRMAHEHAEWTQRTVELGETMGRSSTRILGIRSHWFSVQGDEEAAMKTAQRGIDVAPWLDDASTTECWFMLCGASPLRSKTSREAQNAFQHLQAAVANIPDLDVDWYPLANLVDAALGIDPTAAKAYRQRLTDVASRVKAPQLICHAALFEGHALLGDPVVPDYAAALEHYERALNESRAANDGYVEAIALRAVAMVATGLQRGDALARCHDALDALYEVRLWQKIWQVLDSVVLALARTGRTEEAALVLGHLQAHVPACGMEDILRFRSDTVALINGASDHTAALIRGAQLTADEIVAKALEYCISRPTV